jgi:hypothetical protein
MWQRHCRVGVALNVSVPVQHVVSLVTSVEQWWWKLNCSY